jgi:uncharacterized repeat protein (TIGR04042 family)
MPALHFLIRWPDQSELRCYSPSTVVREHFTPGQSYPLDDFVARSRLALGLASERVREKFGFACSQAMDQLADIEQAADAFRDLPGATVLVIAFN